MATIVASLMATIGGDASGLNKALTGAKGSLQKTAKEMGTFGGSVKDTVKQLAGLAIAGGVAYKAVDAVGDFFKSSVSDTIDYAKAVRDVGRFTGASAEETSKLLQIADDLQVPIESLKMGMKSAVREGVLPTIDGIKDLAKEYQALPNALAKSQFALEKFGRAGMEMQKFLELTPGQLDEMARSAEMLGLVLDEQAIAKTEEYRIAVDQLSDAWTGLKTNVGMQVIPVLADVATQMSTNITENAMWDEIMKTNIYTADELFQKLQDGASIQGIYYEAVVQSTRGLEDLYNASKDAGLITADTSGAISDALDNYGELYTAVDRLNAGMEKYSNTLIFNKAAQYMDADAAIKLGVELGVIDDRTLVLNEALPKLTAQFDANANGMIDAGAEAAAYIAQLMGITNAIISMPDSKVITIDIIYNEHGRPVGIGGGDDGGMRGGIPYEAAGGPVAMGQPYFVGERGMELFVPNTSGRIIPNNQLGNIGGGDTYIINNNSTGAAALTMAIIAQAHRARLGRSMGV